jgi:cytochrome c553
VSDGFGPADWFPGDHPTMPEIVAKGRRPDIRACALCHYPSGQGRAENAGVDALPVEYFIQQLKDFAAGNRKSADTRKANTGAMASIAKAMTDDEIKAAAEYYAAIPFKPWIKVVESTTAPKTRTNVGLFLALDGNETEPLGDRIIEVPVSAEMTETYRNPHSSFIAYVPVGSVKKGEALAKSGQCALCHGADLKGIGPVPPIAGRSPSYMMRQMYDMQQGTRKGLWTGLMKPVVAPLSQDDLLDLVAYVASRTP